MGKYMEEFLKEWNFVESTYYKVINGVVYRDVKAGLIECEDFKKTTRKIGKYRIVAQHFECALPYTNYYLIFDDKIYLTSLHPSWCSNILVDMVDGLKKLN